VPTGSDETNTHKELSSKDEQEMKSIRYVLHYYVLQKSRETVQIKYEILMPRLQLLLNTFVWNEIVLELFSIV
jgi:hypothetical protein